MPTVTRSVLSDSASSCGGTDIPFLVGWRTLSSAVFAPLQERSRRSSMCSNDASWLG